VYFITSEDIIKSIKINNRNMNIRGGGLTDVKEFQSEEMRTFRGGMRHV
jgi:hypothetical protein